MRGKRVKSLSKLFSSLIGVGFYLMVCWMFFTAYFSGEMKMLVSINRYSEAHIEFVLLIVLSPFILFGFYEMVRDSFIGLVKREDDGGV